MQFKFTQAVQIGGHVFSKAHGPKFSVHDVSEDQMKDPHFKRYLDCGYIIPMDGHVEPKQETQAERSKRIAEQFKKEKENDLHKKADAEISEGSEDSSDEGGSYQEESASEAGSDQPEEGSETPVLAPSKRRGRPKGS